MHADDILTFLDSHPDFLQRHAERFGLKAYTQDRAIVSLTDRQMLELKDKARQLEIRLTQLVRHGEANDLIQSRVHQLVLALLADNDFDALVNAVRTCLEIDFAFCHMAMRLWHPASEKYPAYFTTRDTIRAVADNLVTPSCGLYANDEVLSWFAAVPVLQSFSQLALRDNSGKPFGMLVLASDDPKRFTYDMHTNYLAQIGELISAALLRVFTIDEALPLSLR